MMPVGDEQGQKQDQHEDRDQEQDQEQDQRQNQVQIQNEELIALVQALISRNSENPTTTEEEVAVFVLDTLTRHGIAAEFSWAAPGRPNIVARLAGSRPGLGRKLILNGHLDVVPAGAGWSRDPLGGAVEDGKLYGRGSCDMKAGVAAMMYAAITLKRAGLPFSGELILFFNVDEERENAGMKKFLSEDWTADYAVIGEPTELQLCVGHRGVARYRLRTRGTPGHTAFTEQPDNAIHTMAPYIVGLAKLSEEVKSRSHPIVGRSSLAVTQIRGGDAPSMVPGWCEVEIDRRLLPGETREQVRAEIERCLREAKPNGDGVTYELDNYLFVPASHIDPEHSLVQAATRAGSRVRTAAGRIGAPRVEAFAATCEAPFFLLDKGIPTLICGPGSLAQAHTIDEYVEVAQVVEAVQLYIAFVEELL